jgi:hypothetical protein
MAEMKLAHGVLYRAVPEPILDSARIMPCISQCVAASVAEHVAMDLEGQLGALTDALYEPINGIRREWASALCREHESTIWELPLQLSQGPQLVTS